MSIFSDIKTEFETLATGLLVPTYAQEIIDYRAYTMDVSPVVIMTTQGYFRDTQADDREMVDMTLVIVARFEGDTPADRQSEEEAAEAALDDIEWQIISNFGVEGQYQTRPGVWLGIDFYQRSTRPPSPLGIGTRYGEIYLRFFR